MFISYAWMVPPIQGVATGPFGSDWVSFASNMAFDLGGVITPETLKEYWPQLDPADAEIAVLAAYGISGFLGYFFYGEFCGSTDSSNWLGNDRSMKAAGRAELSLRGLPCRIDRRFAWIDQLGLCRAGFPPNHSGVTALLWPLSCSRRAAASGSATPRTTVTARLLRQPTVADNFAGNSVSREALPPFMVPAMPPFHRAEAPSQRAEVVAYVAVRSLFTFLKLTTLVGVAAICVFMV
jgi:hypothetical protein